LFLLALLARILGGMSSRVSDLDLFPAMVKINSLLSPSEQKFYDPARVVVKDDFVLVGVDSRNGPITIFKESIVNIQQNESSYQVTTENNFNVYFRKSRGCGCGSRLRMWRPFGSIFRSDRDA
jgi:hypothetical protein